MTLPQSQVDSRDTPVAREYARLQRKVSLADAAVGVALLVALVATGWSNAMRDLSQQMSGGGYSLGLFFYILMLALIGKAAGAPLDYYSFRLEHRFHLSNQRLGGWLKDQFKGFGVGMLMATVVVEIMYWTMRVAPESWWVIAWAVFVFLVVVLAQLAPVLLLPLFYKFVPLENDNLKARLEALSARAGMRVRGVYEWKLSEKSKKANAALTGLGATRRIILADTLLENYNEDEIEAVLAHELGHHVHGHIRKGIALQVIISFVGFWAANEVLAYAIEELHWFEVLSDYANLPLLALVSTALSLLLLPLLNWYSRYNEREADRYCWRNIASVEPFVSAMNKLAAQNLAERNPARWVEVLLHSHPAISKRVSAAEAWSRSNSARNVAL